MKFSQSNMKRRYFEHFTCINADKNNGEDNIPMGTQPIRSKISEKSASSSLNDTDSDVGITGGVDQQQRSLASKFDCQCPIQEKPRLEDTNGIENMIELDLDGLAEFIENPNPNIRPQNEGNDDIESIEPSNFVNTDKIDDTSMEAESTTSNVTEGSTSSNSDDTDIHLGITGNLDQQQHSVALEFDLQRLLQQQERLEHDLKHLIIKYIGQKICEQLDINDMESMIDIEVNRQTEIIVKPTPSIRSQISNPTIRISLPDGVMHTRIKMKELKERLFPGGEPCK